MDFEAARANMIEQQIRPWNVLESQTLKTLGEIRREDFVPEQHRALAFVDTQVPIGNGEMMLEPKIGARMIEALNLEPSHRVLEIGTGTGYLSALLAMMCNHVYSIEIDPELSAQANRNLAMAGIENVTLLKGDCFSHFKDSPGTKSGFNRVLITGSVVMIDNVFLDLIDDDGIVVGVQGNDPAMQAVVCKSDGSCRSLFETSVPRLRNVAEQLAFRF